MIAGDLLLQRQQPAWKNNIKMTVYKSWEGAGQMGHTSVNTHFRQCWGTSKMRELTGAIFLPCFGINRTTYGRWGCTDTCRCGLGLRAIFFLNCVHALLSHQLHSCHHILYPDIPPPAILKHHAQPYSPATLMCSTQSPPLWGIQHKTSGPMQGFLTLPPCSQVLQQTWPLTADLPGS